MTITPKLALLLVTMTASALVLVATTTAATAAGKCTVRKYPGQPARHTGNLNAKGNWNSFPPTSGLHYNYPARFNIYAQPIPQVAVIHNLEHGGVAIQYGSKVPSATVAKIREWYLGDTNGLLVAPYPRLGSKIALTAWTAPPGGTGNGFVAMCSGFDAAAFTTFVKQHRYKARERFPKANLARS